MRLFVSIDLPQDTRKYIAAVQQELADQNLFEGRLTQPDAIHITLKFLGEVDEKQISEIQKALRSIKMPSFKVCLKNKLGVFPSENNIRIIWLGLESKELEPLTKQVHAALEQFVPDEEREFVGHLTIARVNNVKDKEKLLNYLRSVTIKFLCFEAKEFVLKSSYLTAVGPEHTDIERYPLS